jgi:hypothetical protein
MFQHSKEEFNILLFQIGISSWGGRRTPPYAFTEQEVAMLSGILNSERAITVNIQIMRVFTKVREILMDNMCIRLEIEEIKKNPGPRSRPLTVYFLSCFLSSCNIETSSRGKSLFFSAIRQNLLQRK